MALISSVEKKKESDDEEQELDLPAVVKVAVVGGSAVGKTSFIHSYVLGSFRVDPEHKYQNTFTKTETIDGGKKITVKIIEFHYNELRGFSEQFTSSSHDNLLDCDCFILMFQRNGNSLGLEALDTFGNELYPVFKDGNDYPIKARSVVVYETKSDLQIDPRLDAEYAVMKKHLKHWETHDWRHLKLSFMENTGGGGSGSEAGSVQQRVIHQLLRDWQEQYALVSELQKMGDYRSEVEKNAVLDTCLSREGIIVYDVFIILLSLANVISDLMVTNQWLKQGRTLLVVISCIILIVAQLGQVFQFRTLYPRKGVNCLIILPFVMVLSPFLSLITYFISLGHGFVYQSMIALGFSVEPLPDCAIETKMGRFITQMTRKHQGFQLEAAVEAFPQSILQMAVMVYYSETNWISVASILLSLISVCTKSLVFSYALELRTMIFNYLSIVLDFISVFALITWVFYNPNQSGLTTLGWIWVYKVMISVFPTTILFFYSSLKCGAAGALSMICLGPLTIFTVDALGCFWVAYLLNSGVFEKFVEKDATPLYWSRIFSFIKEAPTWDDSRLRVILVIESLNRDSPDVLDNRLIARISQSRQCMFDDLTWQDLRINLDNPDCGNPISQFLSSQRQMFADFKRLKTEGFFYLWIYILISTTVSSKNESNYFQQLMAVIVGSLQLMWIVSLIFVCRSNFAIWHIYPGLKKIDLDLRTPEEASLKFKRVTDLYSVYKNEPERKQSVLDFFGDDVGSVVIEYMPTLLFEMGDGV